LLGVKYTPMRRIDVHVALVAGAALALGGCGFGDVRAPLPEFMRAKAPEPPPLEPVPDIKHMLREKLDAVFTPASQPTQIRVSEPRPNLRGPGWTACVKAEVVSVTGKPLGTQTYRVEISGGVTPTAGRSRRRTRALPRPTSRSDPYRQRVVARTGHSFSALVRENSTRALRAELSGAR
jgi:hypothetical protein